MRPDADACGRVRHLLWTGRRIQDPDDPLGAEARRRLSQTSGLSPEGVELALAEHLEVGAGEAEIDAFCARVPRAAACHVVVSANVCTAALRALALALAAAPSVCVRPSRRDPVVAELLLRGIEEARREERAPTSRTVRRSAGSKPPPLFELNLVNEVQPARGDELHVYGSDATIALYRERHPEVTMRGHGTGLGVAVIDDGLEPELAAAAVASDIVPFDQRGCLSPRFVLVEGGQDRARTFADALHEALRALSAQIPRGTIDPDMAADIARHRAAVQAVGSWLEDRHHAVGFDAEPRALALPPAARVAHVVPASGETAAPLLGRWSAWIAAIGADGEGTLARAVSALAPRARRSRLGWMQRPPFDGPVDLRG